MQENSSSSQIKKMTNFSSKETSLSFLRKFIKSTYFPSYLIIFLLLLVFIFTRWRISVLSEHIDQSLISFMEESIYIDVDIQQEVPVAIDMPLNEVIDLDDVIPDKVHVKDDIAIDTKVQIKDTVYTKTNLPMVGEVSLAIPIDTTVPIKTTVPIDKYINLEKDSMNLNGNTNLKLNTMVPISMTVPIELNPKELNLEDKIFMIHEMANILRISVLLPPDDIKFR